MQANKKLMHTLQYDLQTPKVDIQNQKMLILDLKNGLKITKPLIQNQKGDNTTAISVI
jgi:hypothetical protein